MLWNKPQVYNIVYRVQRVNMIDDEPVCAALHKRQRAVQLMDVYCNTTVADRRLLNQV